MLWLLPALLALLAPPDANAQDRKRDYDVPQTQFELGSFLIFQRNPSGVTEAGGHLQANWTRFHSDALDWKVEGGFSYFSGSGSDWRSAQVGTGFRYWIDGSTSITPMLRLGIARGGARSPLVSYGADILLKKTFTLEPDGRHEAHRLVVLEMQAGHLAHGSGQAAAHQGFAVATAAYEWPVGWVAAPAGQRVRAKAGTGFETRFGAGRPPERMVVSSFSLRSEDEVSGRLHHKVELLAGIGARRQFRLVLGYTRGF